MVNLYGLITGKKVDLQWWTFPGGERNVKVLNLIDVDHSVLIECVFKSSNDLIDVLLLNNAVRTMGVKNVELRIPYFPFARQDRVMVEGEPFALLVAAQLINTCGFSKISVDDPHSDVLAGMFNPGVLQVRAQWDIWAPKITATLSNDARRAEQYKMPLQFPNGCLVSPDAGALKKIFKLAKKTNLPVIEAGKQRDVATGNILATTIDKESVLQYNTFWVVDDICDGGRTFIELGKVIKEIKPDANLVLCVTHGIFSKGKNVMLEVFDTVLWEHDLSEMK